MYIDKYTIYFSSVKQYCGKPLVQLGLPRILVRIETFLTDYVIQEVRKTDLNKIKHI